MIRELIILIAGLFIGGTAGFILAALCCAASRADHD